MHIYEIYVILKNGLPIIRKLDIFENRIDIFLFLYHTTEKE